MVMANQDFAGQQAGEEVKFIFRRHPSVMTRSIIVVGVILLITVLPLVLWSKTAPWLWYALAIAVILVVVIIFRSWLRWYYSVYIVTNLRIRQQIQQGLFRKTAVDVYLDKVDNISYNISGIRGSLCGYGTIVLYTTAGDLIMTRIADCESVYSNLSTAIRAAGGGTDRRNNEEA